MRLGQVVYDQQGRWSPSLGEQCVVLHQHALQV